MPGRTDTSLANHHRLYVATSGGGKSSAVKATIRSMKPARLIIWDPEGEYRASLSVQSVSKLALLLSKATESNCRYSVALQAKPDPETFERFCRAVWAVACASRPLAVVVEELADVTKSAGKASEAWGGLIRRARKYGVALHVTTQSPTEISKTVYRNVGSTWCGICETEAERRRMAAHLDLSADAMRGLKPLEYYLKRLGEPAEKGKLKFSRGLPRL